ncbi:CocE/NonD family hydrolase [Defluviimonas sp. D31]|uniref:CocE/NonD family hydrolase n=1 Tax=Defluviimonas sp. D31 TaxID=3083253 RepID=UPI00296E87C9|nr:CocE/NonD family hydrolase [Defluviimonas sp. D31]MDW4550332.1 CocE/NonD family hydrolase [Defluviimonas sp. D31]
MPEKIDHSSAGDVRESEHVWIPMEDGTRLAARIWWPGGAGPFPAILEYIPYRKRDMVRARDERNHPYFAAHGYVCLRVDMRGSGDSEGVMPDMYADAELGDARQVIEWIAVQDWSSGAVGMFGTSWGGTASLQAAVDAPGPLKAVLANCATADRFEDDIHWMGGCLLTDSFEWGATLPAILAAPPDSATLGPDWRVVWEDRLRDATFPLEAWIRNRTRGAYWRHGSVRFTAERLSCPVLTIGGWADRYSNSVICLARARPDLCWGIVGPWGHHYPDHAEPGPAVGFQDLALQWWDHWLKGHDNAVADWPWLRLWRREFDPPQDRLHDRNGDWIEIARPGSPGWTRLHLRHDGCLAADAGAAATLAIPSDLRHGICAGDTGYFGRVGGLPLDQSGDDARALCFDSAPLAAALDVIGHPVVSVTVRRDRPRAQLVLRVCDVAPDGRSNLVTRHVVNLALDDKLDNDRPFAAGEPSAYRLTLPATAYRFAVGHRIRLSVAASYWPLVWPELPLARCSIVTDGATLDLPTECRARPLSHQFPAVRRLPATANWSVRSEGALVRDTDLGEPDCLRMSWKQPILSYQFQQTATTFAYRTSAEYRADLDEAVAATCTMEHCQEIARPDGTCKIECTLSSRMTSSELIVNSRLAVRWNDDEVATRVWGSIFRPSDRGGQG